MNAYQDIAIGIISYNVLDLLCRSIESCMTHLPSFPIYVLDNGSTDGTQSHIEHRFPQITLFKNPDNTFFSSGCNTLIRNIESDYVLLMNADIYLKNKSITECFDLIKKDNRHVAVSPSVIDGSLHRHMASSVITPFLSVARDTSLGRPLKNTAWYRKAMYQHMAPTDCFDVEKVSNCCCVINRERFLSLGGFEKGQILYWTEEDIAIRIQKSGLKQAVCGSAVVYHEHGSSTRKLQASLVRAIYIHDRIAYFSRHFGWFKAMCVEVAIVLRIRFWAGFIDHINLAKHWQDIVLIKKKIRSADEQIGNLSSNESR